VSNAHTATGWKSDRFAEGENMSETSYHEVFDLSEGELFCGCCHIPLENGPVTLRYMGSDFPILMPKCPKCGQCLIPEELAIGKILDVERALEDK